MVCVGGGIAIHRLVEASAWCVCRLAEPYALHNAAAVRQHLQGLRDQAVLRLCTSGTTQRIRATTLVQAATLGEGVRDFLFDAFLHVARHDRPPLATPDGESPPPRGAGSGCPPSTRGDT